MLTFFTVIGCIVALVFVLAGLGFLIDEVLYSHRHSLFDLGDEAWDEDRRGF